MESISRGNTPFERVEAGRLRSQKLMVTHIAVVELIKQIEECTAQVKAWQTQLLPKWLQGDITKDEYEIELELATQALKNKKECEAALVVLCERAGEEFGMEA